MLNNYAFTRTLLKSESKHTQKFVSYTQTEVEVTTPILEASSVYSRYASESYVYKNNVEHGIDISLIVSSSHN